jgi:hypothetical protein
MGQFIDNNGIKGEERCICKQSDMYTMYWCNISGDRRFNGDKLYIMPGTDKWLDTCNRHRLAGGNELL